MSRDFLTQVLFSTQLLLVLLDASRKDFKLFWIFEKLFVFAIDSPVYSSLRSWYSPVYSPPGSRPKLVYIRTLLGQNILGSQDSPVFNTPASLVNLVYYSPGIFMCKTVQCTLRSRLPRVFITWVLRLHRVFINGESRLSDVFTTGESRFAGVFITGSHFTDHKEHTTIFEGSMSYSVSVLTCKPGLTSPEKELNKKWRHHKNCATKRRITKRRITKRQKYKTSNNKTPITKRQKLQKVELQNVELQNVECYKRWKNKRSKVTKHYKTSNYKRSIVTIGRKTVQQYMKNSRG